jgi:hypothetical protein
VTLFQISIALALAGFACFLWPILQRLSGRAPAETPESRAGLRSPLWWTGFVLTILALVLQRMASSAGV